MSTLSNGITKFIHFGVLIELQHGPNPKCPKRFAIGVSGTNFVEYTSIYFKFTQVLCTIFQEEECSNENASFYTSDASTSEFEAENPETKGK